MSTLYFKSLQYTHLPPKVLTSVHIGSHFMHDARIIFKLRRCLRLNKTLRGNDKYFDNTLFNQAIPGVLGFYDQSSIPGTNQAVIYPNPEPIFCTGHVEYAGQAIGIVVAESSTLARRYLSNTAESCLSFSVLVPSFKLNWKSLHFF